MRPPSLGWGHTGKGCLQPQHKCHLPVPSPVAGRGRGDRPHPELVRPCSLLGESFSKWRKPAQNRSAGCVLNTFENE